MELTTDNLNTASRLASDVTALIERAWQASMLNEFGEVNDTEKIHQFNLAKATLKELNLLIFPGTAEITTLIAEQRQEIDSILHDVHEMD